MGGLRLKVGHSVVWNSAQRIAKNMVGGIATIVLARFLAPSDFGLVAMMAVFLALASIVMDSGFVQALIRKSNLSQDDLDTAFYANLSFGLLAYACLFFAAPLIGDFYSEPRLVPLIRVAALSVVVTSTQVVHVAILSRELDFRGQFRAALPGSVISGLMAIGLAMLGWGVWALVLQIVLASLVTSCVYWKNSAWRPGRRFNRASFREMYGFGSNLLLAGFMDTVFQHLYVIVIARLFSAAVAGHFYLATRIRDLILMQLVSALQTATYPALASMRSDTARMKSAYRQVVNAISFVLFPVLLFLATMAKELFAAFLPSDWGGAVPYLQLLCVGALLYPLATVNLNIMKAMGRSDLLLWVSIAKKVVIGLALLATYRHGVMAILYGQVAASTINYGANSFYSAKLIGYSQKEQILDVLPALGLSVFLALVAALLKAHVAEHATMVTLLVLCAALPAAYLGLASLFSLEGWRLLREFMHRRSWKGL